MNDKVKELDALAEKATDSEWHPTFQAKTEFQNALVNAWRTWLRPLALRYAWLIEDMDNRKWGHLPFPHGHEYDEIARAADIETHIDAALRATESEAEREQVREACAKVCEKLGDEKVERWSDHPEMLEHAKWRETETELIKARELLCRIRSSINTNGELSVLCMQDIDALLGPR